MAALRALIACGCLFVACQSPQGELRGLAEEAPLEYSVLVTGGGFMPSADAPGTFAGAEEPTPLGSADVLQVLRSANVFLRVGEDGDRERRARVLHQLAEPQASEELLAFLQEARDSGYDLLLVVEGLQDGPVDEHGINSRWPITLATWLLAVGALIPDHTFESRATLRVTLRDLQTGRVVHDPPLVAGRVDLSLIERSDFLGLLMSIVVPPFWVGDDTDRARAAVRQDTARRLLVSLARDLKSAAVRQRLRERLAVIEFERTGDGVFLRIEVDEALAGVRLRQDGRALPDEAVAVLERDLLGSVSRDGARLRYRAPFAVPLAPGPVQVLIGTIGGNVASATLPEAGVR